MKRLILILIIAILFSLSISGKDFKDAGPVLKRMIVSLDEFVNSIEKAEKAESIIKALDNYSKAVIEYTPAFRIMMEKYPELKDERTHPEELKPLMKRMDILMKKMLRLYGKVTEHLNNPKVKEANNKWRKAMSSLTSKGSRKVEVKKTNEVSSLYGFNMMSIDQEKISLEKYKGKVILLVNVASKCGLTPQYKGLQELYTKYKDMGFIILGFPANNFLWQEPGSDSKIKEFCTSNFGVEFPMFSKISVKGKKIHPLYKFLTSEESNPGFAGKIRWNFDKFLADRNGKIIARFHPKTKPFDAKITEAIETAIKEK